MKNLHYRNTCTYALLVVVATWISITGIKAEEIARVELKESVGATFAPQVLHYVVESPKGALKDISRCALKDGKGNAILAQFKPLGAWDDGSIRSLRTSFISGLEPYERKSFSVDDSGSGAEADNSFAAVKTDKAITFASPLVAVEIPIMTQEEEKSANPLEALPPVSRIRGKDKWFGKGSMVYDSCYFLMNRKVSITDDGPIYKRATISYRFGKGVPSSTFAGDTCEYNVEVTLCRGEELARVKENYYFPFTDVTRMEFKFDFYPGMEPDISVVRPFGSGRGDNADLGSYWVKRLGQELFPIAYDKDEMFGALSPWPVYAGSWSHFACYNSHDGNAAEMLGIITTAPEKWDHIAYISPDESWKLGGNPHAFFSYKTIKDVPFTVGKDKSLAAHFALKTGSRDWAFFVGGPFPLTEEVEITNKGAKEKKILPDAPREWFAQRTRHYQMNSLDRIKDWVLEWKADPSIAYPHLYYTAAEFEAKRQKINDWFGSKAQIPSLDDKEYQAKLKKIVLDNSDKMCKALFICAGPPYRLSLYEMANLSDLLLGMGVLTAEEETIVKARLAYAAYFINWKGYWAPEMGYAANPNMSGYCYDSVGLAGLLLRDHPESRTWISAGTTQIDRELAEWVSEDGAGLETPHYDRASGQVHSMLFTALRHCGERDYFNHPKAKLFFNYYRVMQTPPDPDANRQRGVPCIGNGYDVESVNEFNTWAAGLQDSNPEMAGNLMWMWRQHGYGNAEEMKGKVFKLYGAGIENFFGSTLGAGSGATGIFRVALIDPFVKPITPKERREGNFKGFGSVMTSNYPGDKETKAYFRMGQFYSHWDMDQGSLIFWGKGAPLVMDHGYGEFHPWFHSRVNVNHMWDYDLGNVTGYFSGEGASFCDGAVTLNRLNYSEHPWIKNWPMAPEPMNGRNQKTDWRRRIMMMKDANPDGMNYLVMRDTVRGEMPTEWVLWAYGTIDDFTAMPIRAKGKFGVDLLVYLLDKDKGAVSTGKVDIPKGQEGYRRIQTLIHLKREPGRGMLSVLYPALSQEAAPAVETSPDGQVAKIRGVDRTDWVFLPETKVSLKMDNIEFNGLSAAYSQRKNEAYFMIDAGSVLSAEGLTLSSNTPMEATLHGNKLEGRSFSAKVEPVIKLSGAAAINATGVAINGKPATLTKKDDCVIIALPMGEESTFSVELK